MEFGDILLINYGRFNGINSEDAFRKIEQNLSHGV